MVTVTLSHSAEMPMENAPRSPRPRDLETDAETTSATVETGNHLHFLGNGELLYLSYSFIPQRLSR